MCGEATVDLDQTRALAARNDAFRRRLVADPARAHPAGDVIVAPDVAALGAPMQNLILRSIGLRSTFPDDKPDTEHAIGEGRVGPNAFRWAIDVVSKPGADPLRDRSGSFAGEGEILR